MLDRIAYSLRRVSQLAQLTPGGLASAIRLVVALKRRPAVAQRIRYRGREFWFRKQDESAVREVLIDQAYSFLEDRLRELPRPVIVDVGANVGTFSLWVSAQASETKALAVEANPDTSGIARRNLKELRRHGGSWELVQAAAAAGDDDVLHLDTNGQSPSHRVTQHGNLVVPGISLRTVVDRAAGVAGRIDIMKVDIEGSEEAFICADPQALQRVDALVVELHPDYCDAERVRSAVSGCYASITEVGDRRGSAKTLLYCQN